MVRDETVIREKTHPAELDWPDSTTYQRHPTRAESSSARCFSSRPRRFLTGELLPKPIRSTLTIPREVGLKNGQKYLHRGRKWQEWYGLRNTVEAFNSYVKQPLHTDIEDPATRQARGNTFATLVATLAIVTANVRKIETFLMELHRGEPSTSSNKYDSIDSVEREQLEELEEAEMIEAELLAQEIDPPPR